MKHTQVHLIHLASGHHIFNYNFVLNFIILIPSYATELKYYATTKPTATLNNKKDLLWCGGHFLHHHTIKCSHAAAISKEYDDDDDDE